MYMPQTHSTPVPSKQLHGLLPVHSPKRLPAGTPTAAAACSATTTPVAQNPRHTRERCNGSATVTHHMQLIMLCLLLLLLPFT